MVHTGTLGSHQLASATVLNQSEPTTHIAKRTVVSRARSWRAECAMMLQPESAFCRRLEPVLRVPGIPEPSHQGSASLPPIMSLERSKSPTPLMVAASFCAALGCSSGSADREATSDGANVATTGGATAAEQSPQASSGTLPGASPAAMDSPAGSTAGSDASSDEVPPVANPDTETGSPGDSSEPGNELGDPVTSSEPDAETPTDTSQDVPTTDEPANAAPEPEATPSNDGAPDGSEMTPSIELTGPPVTRHGQLRVDGNRVVGEHGQPVTLRGQGFGWDNWWPQYYNADVVAWLRNDWCVDMVRPAMGIEPDGAYLADPGASTERVTAVVDAAIANDIYVIIDWHAHDMHQDEAVAFFRQMAQRYGDQPNVIYEVFNEPEDDETWPQVKTYAEAVIAAIREHDPDNLVIVGSPEWDQRIDLVAADPITSFSNIVYSVHFYAATHGAWLRERTQAALDSGIAVFVSESSGSEAAGTGANDYDEWQAWFDFMDQNQISWINYSVSDKEGETISVLQPGAPANGNWDESQLTETGQFIRNVFVSYCD